MKNQSICAVHPTPAAFHHLRKLRRRSLHMSCETRVRLVNEMRRHIGKIRPPVLEERNQWQFELLCDSPGLHVPPAMSNSDEHIRPKRVNLGREPFFGRQNWEQAFPSLRQRSKTKLSQLTDNFQTKRKLLPGHDLGLDPRVQLQDGGAKPVHRLNRARLERQRIGRVPLFGPSERRDT